MIKKVINYPSIENHQTSKITIYLLRSFYKDILEVKFVF